jgi:hypothetical protein
MEVMLMILFPFRNDDKYTTPIKFVQMTEIPDALVRPEMRLQVYINKEVHTFSNPAVFWNQKIGACMELTWSKADDYDTILKMRGDKSWKEGHPIIR